MHDSVIGRIYFPSNNTNFNPKIDNMQNLPLERIVAAVRDEIKDFFPQTKNELRTVLEQIQQEVKSSNTKLNKKIEGIEHMLELISDSCKVNMPKTKLLIKSSSSDVKPENTLDMSNVLPELNMLALELAKDGLDHKAITAIHRQKDVIKNRSKSDTTLNEYLRKIDEQKIITAAGDINSQIQQRKVQESGSHISNIVNRSFTDTLKSSQHHKDLRDQSERVAETKEKIANGIEQMEVEGSHDDERRSDNIRMGRNTYRELLDTSTTEDRRVTQEQFRVFKDFVTGHFSHMMTIENERFTTMTRMLNSIIFQNDNISRNTAINAAGISMIARNQVDAAIIVQNVGRITSAVIREAIVKSRRNFFATIWQRLDLETTDVLWKQIVKWIVTVLWVIVKIIVLVVFGINQAFFTFYKVWLPRPIQVAVVSAIIKSITNHVCRAIELTPGETVNVPELLSSSNMPRDLIKIVIWFQNTFLLSSSAALDRVPFGGGWWALSVILSLFTLLGGAQSIAQKPVAVLDIFLFCLFSGGSLLSLFHTILQTAVERAKAYINVIDVVSGIVWSYPSNVTGKWISSVYYFMRGISSIQNVEVPEAVSLEKIWDWDRILKPVQNLGVLEITRVASDQTMFGSNGDPFTSVFYLCVFFVYSIFFFIFKDRIDVLQAIEYLVKNAWKGNQEVALSAKESLTIAKNKVRIALGSSRARFRESMGYRVRAQYENYARLKDWTDQNIADLLDPEIIDNIRIMSISRETLENAENNQRVLQMTLAIAHALKEDAQGDFPNRVKRMLETQLNTMAGSITDSQILSTDSVEEIMQAMSDPAVVNELLQNMLRSLGETSLAVAGAVSSDALTATTGTLTDTTN